MQFYPILHLVLNQLNGMGLEIEQIVSRYCLSKFTTTGEVAVPEPFEY